MMNNMENNTFYNNYLTSLKAYLYDETVKLNTLNTDNSAVIALAQQEVAFLSQINPYVEKIGELLENIENISVNIDSLNRGEGTNNSGNDINGLPELQPLNLDDVSLNPNLEEDDSSDVAVQNQAEVPSADEVVSPVVEVEDNTSEQVQPVEDAVVPTAPVEQENNSVVPVVVSNQEQVAPQDNTVVVSDASAEQTIPVVEEAPVEAPSVVPVVVSTSGQVVPQENSVVEDTNVNTVQTQETIPVQEVQSDVPSVTATPLVSDITSSINGDVDTKQDAPAEVDINSAIYNKVDTNPAKAVLTSSSQIKKLRSSRVNCEMAFFNTEVSEDTVEAKQKKIEYLMAQASQLYNSGQKQEAQVLYDEIRKINDELQKNSQS